MTLKFFHLKIGLGSHGIQIYFIDQEDLNKLLPVKWEKIALKLVKLWHSSDHYQVNVIIT